jgi:Tol biopolymer transport system component
MSQRNEASQRGVVAAVTVFALVAALAFGGSAGRPEISFWSGFAHAEVYVMAADGSGARRLTNLYSAKRGAWSPEGKRLAFDGRFYKTLSDFDIGIMRADGSGVRRVTRGPERDVMASWSPDGRWLAFSRVRNEGDMPDVWLVRPSGKGAHRLVHGGAPSWSPSGRWIAFEAPGGIWAVHPDGSGRRRIVPGNVGALKWSPDGRRVAYTSWRGNTSEIYVARADGSAPRRLTRNGVDDFDPSWSPDGRKILYTHGRENAHAVHVMRSDGSGKHGLTRGGDSWATSWRPASH